MSHDSRDSYSIFNLTESYDELIEFLKWFWLVNGSSFILVTLSFYIWWDCTLKIL